MRGMERVNANHNKRESTSPELLTENAEAKNPKLRPNTLANIMMHEAVMRSVLPNHLSAMKTGAGNTNSCPNAMSIYPINAYS